MNLINSGTRGDGSKCCCCSKLSSLRLQTDFPVSRASISEVRRHGFARDLPSIVYRVCLGCTPDAADASTTHRSLDWPFPYPIEVAIIDQSPNYWRRDYSVSLDASSADCGSSPFMQPSASVEFCFITVQSMELLTLPHYNFIRDDVLKIRFQSKAVHLSRKATAAVSVRDHSLVAEYSWLIPDIENKLERFDYSGRKVKTFTSDKFYTNSQGEPLSSPPIDFPSSSA